MGYCMNAVTLRWTIWKRSSYFTISSSRRETQLKILLCFGLPEALDVLGFLHLLMKLVKPCFSFMWDFALTNFLSVQKLRVIYETKSSPVLIGLWSFSLMKMTDKITRGLLCTPINLLHHTQLPTPQLFYR